MKLQYKNNQWEAGEVPIPQGDYQLDKQVLEAAIECFKPIAPNDQEKVTKLFKPPHDCIQTICECLTNGKISCGKNVNHYWQPEIGKLYDSGDLVFEEQFIILNQYDSFHTKVWALKSKESKIDRIKKALHENSKSKPNKKNGVILTATAFESSEAKEIEIPTTNSIHRK